MALLKHIVLSAYCFSLLNCFFFRSGEIVRKHSLYLFNFVWRKWRKKYISFSWEKIEGKFCSSSSSTGIINLFSGRLLLSISESFFHYFTFRLYLFTIWRLDSVGASLFSSSCQQTSVTGGFLCASEDGVSSGYLQSSQHFEYKALINFFLCSSCFRKTLFILDLFRTLTDIVNSSSQIEGLWNMFFLKINILTIHFRVRGELVLTAFQCSCSP